MHKIETNKIVNISNLDIKKNEHSFHFADHYYDLSSDIFMYGLGIQCEFEP